MVCGHRVVQIQDNLTIVCVNCGKIAPGKAFSTTFIQGTNTKKPTDGNWQDAQ